MTSAERVYVVLDGRGVPQCAFTTRNAANDFLVEKEMTSWWAVYSVKLYG